MISETKLKEVRGLFESNRIPHTTLVDLYRSYAKIPDYELFVSRAMKLFPKGNCGLTSLYLRDLLKKGEIVQGTYGGEPHTFLMCEELVVDITADQFGGPPVYMGPLTRPWSMQ